MDNLIFSDKATVETIPLTVVFSDRLQYGETITGVAISVVVVSGVDSNPSAMLSGSPTYTPTTVSQAITAGVAGVVYMIVFAVTGSGGHNYVKQGRLVVVVPGAF